jgi:hypothetical protein
MATTYTRNYLLSCEALSTTQEIYAFTVFERVFKEYGLPNAIRTDNGVPFASPHALYGLSKPSAASEVRRLHRMLQQRTAAPGAQHEISGRALPTFLATVSRTGRADLPVLRPHHHHHAVRPYLPRQAKD